MMPTKDSPVAESMSPEKQDWILHAYLQSGDLVLMASDCMDGGEATHGSSISLCLMCKSQDEAKELYSKLGEGGKVVMPLKEEFFGLFGSVEDKYGIEWMIQFSENKE